MGTIITILIFFLPFGFYLFSMLRARMDRGPRGVSGERVSAAKTAKPPRQFGRSTKRARARELGDQDCGKLLTHLFLTITGSRDSCRSCRALQDPASAAAHTPIPIRAPVEAQPERDDEAAADDDA